MLLALVRRYDMLLLWGLLDTSIRLSRRADAEAHGVRPGEGRGICGSAMERQISTVCHGLSSKIKIATVVSRVGAVGVWECELGHKHGSGGGSIG